MTLPVLLHSGMTGAPQVTLANGSVNALLHACLVNGFNTQSVSTATASGGVVTLNFASAPGFSTLDTVVIAGASNSTVNGQFRVQSAASNQVLVSIPGVPDGAVGGTITLKVAPLGWTRPYSGTQIGAYRQGGGEPFNRFIRVRDNAITSAFSFRIRGYENMTAISTGTGPFPTTVQIAGDGVELYGPYFSGSTANVDPRPWVIVGTPRAFYLCIGAFFDNGGVPANGLLPPEDVFLGSVAAVMFFGDAASKGKPGDAFHTFITGANNYPIVSDGYAFIARNVSGASGAKIVKCVAPTNGVNSTSLGGGYPSAANGGLTLLGPAFITDHEAPFAFRGLYPGMMCPIELPTGSDALKVGATITPITGATGRVLLLASNATAGNSDFFVALDEDWGDV